MNFPAQELIGFVGEICMKMYANILTVLACQCRVKLWNISLKAEKLCFILLMRFKKD